MARKRATVTQVYMYRFTRVSPSRRAMWGGAAHGTEVPYVFGNVGNATRFEAADRVLGSARVG